MEDYCSFYNLDDCSLCKKSSLTLTKRCKELCFSSGERCKRYGKYEGYCRQHYIAKNGVDPYKEKKKSVISFPPKLKKKLDEAMEVPIDPKFSK